MTQIYMWQNPFLELIPIILEEIGEQLESWCWMKQGHGEIWVVKGYLPWKTGPKIQSKWKKMLNGLHVDILKVPTLRSYAFCLISVMWDVLRIDCILNLKTQWLNLRNTMISPIHYRQPSKSWVYRHVSPCSGVSMTISSRVWYLFNFVLLFV